MNALLLALALPSTGSLVGIIVWVAILALVIWGIIALVRWSGLTIPQPVVIVFTVLVGIFLILLLARIFGFVT